MCLPYQSFNVIMRTPFRPVSTSTTQSSSSSSLTSSSSTSSSSHRSSPMQISSRPSPQQVRHSNQSSDHHHHRSSLHSSSHSNNTHSSSNHMASMSVKRHMPDHTFASTYSAGVPMHNMACSPTASRTSPMAVPPPSSPTIHSHSQSFVPPHLLASMSKKPEPMARSYNKRRPPSWL